MDFPVPRSPMISTPPRAGSMMLRMRPSFMSACPVIFTNGNTGLAMRDACACRDDVAVTDIASLRPADTCGAPTKCERRAPSRGRDTNHAASAAGMVVPRNRPHARAVPPALHGGAAELDRVSLPKVPRALGAAGGGGEPGD